MRCFAQDHKATFGKFKFKKFLKKIISEKKKNCFSDSEREAKFVQERIDAVEKHFAELCTVFAAYTRKAARWVINHLLFIYFFFFINEIFTNARKKKCFSRLRDKNDEVAKTIQTYADSEDVNRSMSACLNNFANTLAVIGDYR